MKTALTQLSYDDRLKLCMLATLETRKINGDQIDEVNIMHGFKDTDRSKFVQLGRQISLKNIM